MKPVAPSERLHKLVTEAGSQRAAASKLGISQAYLSDLLHDRREFSQPMLDKLGLKRQIVQK